MTAAFARHTLPLWLLLRNGRRLDRIQEWIGPVLPIARRSGAVPGLAEPDFEPRPVADSNSAIASKDPGHLGLKRRRRSAQRWFGPRLERELNTAPGETNAPGNRACPGVARHSSVKMRPVTGAY